MLIRTALYYAAASPGGLAVVLSAWVRGQIGEADRPGVAIKPKLEPTWVYRAMVWGGLWGLIFLVPIKIEPLWLKGALLTLAPILAAFVYFIPMRGPAMFALDKGALAPPYIHVSNLPWDLLTAYLGRAMGAAERAA
jgi:hypothetical protein